MRLNLIFPSVTNDIIVSYIVPLTNYNLLASVIYILTAPAL